MRRRLPGPALLLAVAAGGALGAVLRWLAVGAVPPDGAPWATLAVNVLGSAALAALALVVDPRRRPVLAAALGPGLLGGFTTFSAYADQGRALAADGHPGQSLGHLLATVAACLVAVHVVRRTTTPPPATDGVER